MEVDVVDAPEDPVPRVLCRGQLLPSMWVCTAPTRDSAAPAMLHGVVYGTRAPRFIAGSIRGWGGTGGSEGVGGMGVKSIILYYYSGVLVFIPLHTTSLLCSALSHPIPSRPARGVHSVQIPKYKYPNTHIHPHPRVALHSVPKPKHSTAPAVDPVLAYIKKAKAPDTDRFSGGGGAGTVLLRVE